MHNFSEFKEIPGFPNYLASVEGKIYSVKRNRFLKHSRNNKGYLNVRMKSSSGRTKTIGVHRVLCLCFKPYPGDVSNLIVNHIDGNKINNDLNNLEWGTYGYNTRHAGALGLTSKCKPILVVNYITQEVTEFASIIDCATAFGVSKDNINYRVKTKGKVLFPEKMLYLFKSDKDEFFKNFMRKNYVTETHGTKKSIYVKDLKSGKIETYDKMSDFCNKMKLPLPTLTGWLNRVHQPVVPGLFQIKLISDPTPWREISDVYLELIKTTGCKPVVVTTEDGECKIYTSPIECCNELKINPTCLNYRLKSNGKTFYSGKSYAYYTDSNMVSLTGNS